MNQSMRRSGQQDRGTTCPSMYICCFNAIINGTTFHSEKWILQNKLYVLLRHRWMEWECFSSSVSYPSKGHHHPPGSLSQKLWSPLRHFSHLYPHNQSPKNPSDCSSLLHSHGHCLSSESQCLNFNFILFYSVPGSKFFEISTLSSLILATSPCSPLWSYLWYANQNHWALHLVSKSQASIS